MSGGTLAAASTTAFGNGDVYVGSGGGVKIAANAPVTIATRYTQLDNTTLELDIDGNGGGRLRVGGPLTVGRHAAREVRERARRRLATPSR